MADLVKIEAKNLKRVQANAYNTIAAMDSGGEAAVKAITFATLRLHRYMVSITHYRTGRLRNSLFPEITGDGGRIFTNVNYAAAEEERGGTHAFMARTAAEDLPQTAEVAMRLFEVGIESKWEGGE